MTNGGDETDLVIAFNEQVLLGRCGPAHSSLAARSCSRACGASTSMPTSPPLREDARSARRRRLPRLRGAGWNASAGHSRSDPRRGKNMFALGMLCSIYSLGVELARQQIALTFGKKDWRVIDSNVRLLEAGMELGGSAPRLQHAFRPSAARRHRSS